MSLRWKNILCIIFPIILLKFNESVKVKKDKNWFGKCRILALEGGGDRGAYQAGAIKGLVDFLPKGEAEWDVVTGISVGSINAGMIIVHAKGNETAAADGLVKNWREMSGSDIYQNWSWFGPLYGLLFKPSFFDTSPEREYLTKKFQNFPLPIRDVVIGATNLNNGDYNIFQNNDIKNVSDFVNSILTSTAVPLFFPPQQHRNYTYIDGGVKFNLDLINGVKKCQEKGYTNPNIIIDIVLCYNATIPVEDAQEAGVYGVYNRLQTISYFDQSMTEIENLRMFMKDLVIRNIIAPSVPLPTSRIPLFFSRVEIEQMLQLGLDDAKDAVKNPAHVEMIVGKKLKKTAEKYGISMEELNKREKIMEYLLNESKKSKEGGK